MRSGLDVRFLNASGDFVEGYAVWTVWGTITFWRETSEEEVRALTKAFLRWVAKNHGSHVKFALGMEEQLRGVLHVHVLLELPAITTDEAAGRLRARWGHGRSEFKLYRPGKAGVFYVVGHEEWQVQVACPRYLPCRRREGCKEAPGPW